jgi:hypothetical protein
MVRDRARPQRIAARHRQIIAHPPRCTFALAIACATIAFGAPARAQAGQTHLIVRRMYSAIAIPRDTSGVHGQVRSIDGPPIAGVRVRVLAAADSGVRAVQGITGDDGRFQILGLFPGSHVLEFRRLGFRPETLTVEAPTSSGGALMVPLTPLAVALPAVAVREEAAPRVGPFREFEAHRQRGFGNFITRRDIEQRRAYRTSDLFRTVANLEVERDGSRAVVRMRGRHCDPLVWLDRVPLVGGFPDLDAVAPNSIEGIEIYSGVSTIPPDLIGPREAGGCGVIVLWTRHGERPAPKVSQETPTVDFGDEVRQQRVFTADQVDSMAAPLTALALSFPYPEALLNTRKDGTVLAEFVVDTLGRIRAGVVNIVASSDPLFADVVRRTLLSTRFSSAVRRGQLVEQVVFLPVSFVPRLRGDIAP